jgi:hypothetical protein
MTAPDPTATLAALDWPTPCVPGCGRAATWTVTLTHADWDPCTVWAFCDRHHDAEDAAAIAGRLRATRLTCRPHRQPVTWVWERIGATT